MIRSMRDRGLGVVAAVGACAMVYAFCSAVAKTRKARKR